MPILDFRFWILDWVTMRIPNPILDFGLGIYTHNHPIRYLLRQIFLHYNPTSQGYPGKTYKQDNIRPNM
ncbi:hypothetical protein NIES4074_14650 [Cylindrospermum sp. NIES-4074]|nr:hypothetical protein NIES4074_14650 [Cylindrospermum sp. NIES-4074]